MPTFMCTSPFLVELGRNRAGAFFSALSYRSARAPPFTVPYRESPCLRNPPPLPAFAAERCPARAAHMPARRLRRRAGFSTVTPFPHVNRRRRISSMPPALKRTVIDPSTFSSTAWSGWKRNAKASRAVSASKRSARARPSTSLRSGRTGIREHDALVGLGYGELRRRSAHSLSRWNTDDTWL